jgi:hypothetical protein
MRTLIKVLLILLLPCLGFAGNSLPWEAKNSVPPNGRYELFWKEVGEAELQKRGGTPPYKLIFRDLQTGITRSVEKFEASVSVLWAPDSNHFATTYHWGSNIAFVRVYPSQGALNGIDPYDNIKSALGKLPEVENDNHIYFHALQWQDKDRLWIRLFGHWDTYGAKEFDYYFEISLDGGVRRLSQVEIETVKRP